MSFDYSAGSWVPSIYGPGPSPSRGSAEEPAQEPLINQPDEKSELIEQILETKKQILGADVEYKSEMLKAEEFDAKMNSNTRPTQNGKCMTVDFEKKMKEKLAIAKTELSQARSDMDAFNRTRALEKASLKEVSNEELQEMLERTELELEEKKQEDFDKLQYRYKGLIGGYEYLTAKLDPQARYQYMSQLRAMGSPYIEGTKPKEKVEVDNSFLGRLQRVIGAISSERD